MHILLSFNGYSADFRSEKILLSCCLFSDLGEGDWAMRRYLRGASCYCCRQHSVFIYLNMYCYLAKSREGDFVVMAMHFLFDGTLE